MHGNRNVKFYQALCPTQIGITKLPMSNGPKPETAHHQQNQNTAVKMETILMDPTCLLGDPNHLIKVDPKKKEKSFGSTDEVT